MNDDSPIGSTTAPNPPGLEEAIGNASDIPEAFAQLLEAVGSQTEVQVSLSRFEEGIGRWALVHSGTRVLTAHETGTKFGQGEYRETVQWRTQGSTRGPMRKREVVFVVGREYGLGQASASLQAPVQPAPDPGKELDRVLDLAAKVVNLGGGRGDNQIAPVLALVEKLMDRMDRDREADRARYEKLLEIVQRPAAAAAPPAVQLQPMEALRELIAFGKEMGVPVVKEMGGSNEEAKPVWMGAVEMIGDNVGKFLEMMNTAQQSKLARVRLLANPQARKIMAAKPHFENPETRAKMIAQLDEKVGKETVDKILQALGVAR